MLNNKENFRLTESQLRDKIYSEIYRCESAFNIKLRVRFVWKPTNFIGTFSDKMTLSVNLYAFDFSDCVQRSDIEFFYSYFISYIVKYIELINVSFKNKPLDYLEGLAVADTIFRLNENGEIKMCIPLMSRRLREKKCRYLSPSDLYCSINAFGKALIFFDSKAENTELKKTNCLLCSWGKVPEICYYGSNIPLYSYAEILRNTILSDSKKNGRYIDRIRSMTVTELTEDGILNENPFSTGLAVRLFSFMKSHDIEIILSKETARHNLENAISEFGISASEFLKVCNGSESKFLKDNCIAVSEMMKKLNCISVKYGLNIKNGNVHMIFP